jgi:hypothetical protein
MGFSTFLTIGSFLSSATAFTLGTSFFLVAVFSLVIPVTFLEVDVFLVSRTVVFIFL